MGASTLDFEMEFPFDSDLNRMCKLEGNPCDEFDLTDFDLAEPSLELGFLYNMPLLALGV